MSNVLIFDARFTDSSNVGQAVDSSLTLQIFQSSNSVTPVETRSIGTDQYTSLVQTTDAQGVFYSTYVNVSTYIPGDVTAKWFAHKNAIPVQPFPFVETQPFPEPQGLSGGDIKGYIRDLLGFPSVQVELADNHYNRIIQKTLLVYNRHLPRLRRANLLLVPGVNKYPIPGMTSRGVAHVEFVRKEGTPLVSDPLFGREYPRGQQLDFDQYVLGISFWKSLQRVTGQEPDWRWDPVEKALYIDIGGTDVSGDSGSYKVTYWYFEDNGLMDVPSHHHQWVRDYALCLAKQVVGTIRNKYSGKVPAPGGEMIIDGKELIDEGREDEKDLLKRIRDEVPPVPAFLG